MNESKGIKELIKALEGLKDNKKLYIQTHNFPDPDAIACAFGLGSLLKSFGIKSTLCSVGQIDRISAARMISSFGIELFEYDDIKDNMSEDDYIICVDSQKNAGNITDLKGDEIACIDHHPTFKQVEYKYKDVRIVGACSTLIAQYFFDAKITPSADVATALLYGMKMDTMQFSRGVTPLDIEMFGFLMPLCDAKKLKTLETNSIEFNDLKAYGAAIENIHLLGTNGFAQIPFACPDGLIGAISDFILALEEVDVAVVYSIRDGGIKLSVRSERDDVDAGELARSSLKGLGNGGGHATMAGGFVPISNILAHLGTDFDSLIEERFMSTILRMKQAASL